MLNVLRATLYALGLALNSLKNNWSLAGLSLVLAVMLWVFVTDVENPTRTDFFPATIPVETVNVSRDLAVASLSESAVSVRISAPEDTWDDLTRDNFRASVDLSGVSQREVEVTVRVEVTGAGGVEIVEVSPRRVAVSLETVTSKAVPVLVQLAGAPPLGYAASPATVVPEQVMVSGPESLVNLVEEAVADVNLTGVRVSLEQVFSVTARDSHGGDIDGVTLQPNTVAVDLPIVQQEFTTVYVVNPAFRGVPAEGFTVTDVTVEPSFVSVTGPIEVLQSISTVATEEVDIDGATSDVIRVVDVRLPAGATVQGQESVTVQVSVAPLGAAQSEVAFDVTPRLDGLAPDLTATLSPTVVRVRVAANISILSALSSSDVVVTLDVSGLAAGVHDVEVEVEVPPGVSVVSLDPSTVEVTLS